MTVEIFDPLPPGSYGDLRLALEESMLTAADSPISLESLAVRFATLSKHLECPYIEPTSIKPADRGVRTMGYLLFKLTVADRLVAHAHLAEKIALSSCPDYIQVILSACARLENAIAQDRQDLPKDIDSLLILLLRRHFTDPSQQKDLEEEIATFSRREVYTWFQSAGGKFVWRSDTNPSLWYRFAKQELLKMGSPLADYMRDFSEDASL